jgi:hypothetical protein
MTITLSLPEPDFDVGLTPVSVRVHPDFELEAILLGLTTDDGEKISFVISPNAAIGMVLGLTDSLGMLMDGLDDSQVED